MSALQAALKHSETLVGTEVGVSNWIKVDQPMIDQFAQTTFDNQWIHIDPERAAAETPFGGTIAHGFLTLSLASRFAFDCLAEMPGQVMSVNYGMNKLRFLKPVLAGARLRGRFTLQKATKRNTTDLLLENLLTIEIEAEKTPALVADWLGLTIFED